MNFLFLTVLFPVLGSILLIFFQESLPKRIVSIIGTGSVGLSALISIFITVDFLNCVHNTNGSFFFIQPLFVWISMVDFCIPINFKLDGLSLTMLLLVIWMGFLIHLYASWYMFSCISYSRFFSYMNLFVASMIILVLADNLLIMYCGWEGVGLCSYLLIGFYYTDLKHGEAALKSFIMTRIGDIFLICAIFMLYKYCHTLEFSKLMVSFSGDGSKIYPSLMTLFLLIASVAKSAQFPFQSWLPDAMVAPAPVSALVHSATMVTAGVYLIARTYNLFIVTPEILYLIGIIGSITLIISSCSALVQTNIKKILAYSTIGQISYMFIALSVQAWEAAIFHLVIHAFSKALLFLASGSLILICRGEQNIFKMPKVGSRSYKITFLLYFSFLVGGASLSGIPIITSGFYSKGDILWNVLLSKNCLFIMAGFLGSFLTSLYTFRMIFVIFHKKFDVSTYKLSNSFLHYLPLLVLLTMSTYVGTLIKKILTFIPLSTIDFLNDFSKLFFEICLSFLVMLGLCLSSMYYLFSYRGLFDKFLDSSIGKSCFRCCFFGCGFDWMYKKIFIKPYLFITRLVSFDPINIGSNFIVLATNFLSNKLVLIENGRLNYYITSIILGALIILILLVFL